MLKGADVLGKSEAEIYEAGRTTHIIEPELREDAMVNINLPKQIPYLT
jgi:hypothetical protein